jgi:hypothetical protein
MAEPGAELPSSPDGTLLPAETPPEYRSKEQQVEDILRGAFEPATDAAPPAPETGAQAEPAAETPLDVAAIAEKLGVDPAKLYEVRIPLADGAEPVTLGQLKDAYRDAQALERERSELTEQRGHWHADQLRQQRELETILAAIKPDAVDPKLAQAVQAVNRERASREAEALFRTIPTWVDEKAREADLVQIVAHLKPYGITRQDLDAVTDHRILRVLRDKALDAAKLTATPAPKPAQKGAAPRKAAQPSPAQAHGQLKAAVTKGHMRPVDAVARILGGIK